MDVDHAAVESKTVSTIPLKQHYYVAFGVGQCDYGSSQKII
jgi:hypothetical protein